MARKRPRTSAYPSRIANGFVYQALSHLDDLIQPLPSPSINSLVRSPLTEVEDHRLWNPDRVPSARSTKTWRNHPQLAPRRRLSGSTQPLKQIQALTFHAPKYVAICVRRGRRREVLHALKKIGKGAGTKKRPHRNYWSNVRC